MKKLFLLPLLVFALVGCNNSTKGNTDTTSNEVVEKEAKWETVDKTTYKSFRVYVGELNFEYSFSSYSEIQFRSYFTTEYARIDVKATQLSYPNEVKNNTFVGKTLNYVLVHY